MPAHSNRTRDFPQLDKRRQASAVNAMLNNVQRAMEHRIQNAPTLAERDRIKNLSVQQLLRLAARLSHV